MNLTNHVKTKFHEVVSETPKSVVLDITVPGSHNRATVRIPKALCRQWTNDTVYVYARYFSLGMTHVNVVRAAPSEFDDVPGQVEDLAMPDKHTLPHKQWIIDEVMTAYDAYAGEW